MPERLTDRRTTPHRTWFKLAREAGYTEIVERTVEVDCWALSIEIVEETRWVEIPDGEGDDA